MQYHWVEWDMWDGRTRRYAILEKKIIFEKNKKNRTVSVSEISKSLLVNLQKDVDRWIVKNRICEKEKSEVKILDEVSSRSKIFELVGRDGELISFGHTLFEITFSVKLAKF